MMRTGGEMAIEVSVFRCSIIGKHGVYRFFFETSCFHGNDSNDLYSTLSSPRAMKARTRDCVMKVRG